MYRSIYMECPKLTNIDRQRVDEWFPGDGRVEGVGGVTTSLGYRNCFEMTSY